MSGSLATELPDGCTWNGPASDPARLAAFGGRAGNHVRHKFGNKAGSGTSSLMITGNAYGLRQVECAVAARGDVLAIVSFYHNSVSSEPALW